MNDTHDSHGSNQVTGVTSEPVGECEECDREVTLQEAKTESYAGPEGRITLLFCPECVEAARQVKEGF